MGLFLFFFVWVCVFTCLHVCSCTCVWVCVRACVCMCGPEVDVGYLPQYFYTLYREVGSLLWTQGSLIRFVWLASLLWWFPAPTSQPVFTHLPSIYVPQIPCLHRKLFTFWAIPQPLAASFWAIKNSDRCWKKWLRCGCSCKRIQDHFLTPTLGGCLS